MRAPLAAVCAWCALFAAVSATAARPGPRTVVGPFAGSVASLAFGAGRVAWLDEPWRVHIVNLATHRGRVLAYPKQCCWADRDAPPRILFGNRRFAWVSTMDSGRGGEDITDTLYMASADARSARAALAFEHGAGGEFEHLLGVEADVSGLTYGYADVEETDRGVTLSGGVWSLAAGVRGQLADAPPALVLARGDGRVAVLPAARANQEPRPSTELTFGRFQIRDGRTGALVSTPPVTDAMTRGIDAVVLTSGRVVVLAPDSIRLAAGGATRSEGVERFDARTGKRLGGTRLPAGTEPSLVLAGGQAVSHSPNEIDAIDPATGSLRVLVRRSGTWRIGAVAANGSTLVWAEENASTSRSRIRMLALPR